MGLGNLEAMSESNGHVYMVDDNSEIRVHLSALLQRYGYSVSSYASAEEFLERSIEITPAALLLDMRLPGLSGVELQKRLNAAGRGTPIIFISGESRNEEIIDSFRGGAVEFLWKPFPVEALLQAIDQAIDKDRQREEHMRKSRLVVQRMQALTPREREFMLLMLDGHTNKDIAELVGVTADNIKKYRAHILDKMHVCSLAQLIVMCREAGIAPARSAGAFDTGLSDALN